MSDFSTRRVMMVDTQVRPSDVTKFPIIEAMLAIPREVYVPPAQVEAAYVGENLPLGPGRVVLDARTFAKMLDALDVQPTSKVLLIAPGHGYSAAVLGRLAGSVLAVEEDAAFADAARAALDSQGAANVVVASGALSAGAAAQGPFDLIVIEGGVEIVPDAILAQLAEGGKIAAVFMEGALGTVRVGHKSDGLINWRFAFNASAPVLPGFAAARSFSL